MLAPRVPKIACAASRRPYLVFLAALACNVCGRDTGVCFSPLVWLILALRALVSTHGAISLAGPAPGRPRYERVASYDLL